METKTDIRRIVQAAVRRGGKTVTGRRHGDAIMAAVLQHGFEKPVLSDEQGFVDDQGKFLTRREAMVVAEAAGQVPPGTTGALVSEDLY